MNCVGFCNSKKQELVELLSNSEEMTKDYLYDRIMNIVSSSFIAGAESMIDVSKAKSNAEASRRLQALANDIFISQNKNLYLKFLFDMIDSHTDERGKLELTFKDDASMEVYELFKTIYDAGFINGIELSKDPAVLKLYLKNKDKFIHEG